MLCGFICGGDEAAETSWLDQLLPKTAEGDVLLDDARSGLRALAAATQADISDPELGLTLLPPDDDCPLEERATALYDWVRGFLYALGVQGISEEHLSEETREIYRDFTDLTRMDLDGLEETEENEEALTEVTEFIRVAAMLIHEERASTRAEAPFS